MEKVKAKCQKARGRGIPRNTVLRLMSVAAGWCENPECPTGSLWYELEGGEAVKLAEVAHIIAASDQGPRGDVSASSHDLIAFDNLILLCPNCHTIVDRAPEEHPVNALRSWKSSHETRSRSLLSIQKFTSRSEAYTALARILAENRQIWLAYGPESEAAIVPESADSWLRQVSGTVIPNNYRISALLETNAQLLNPEEHDVVGLFEAHRRGLEHRHLGIDVGVAAPRFPSALESVFRD